MNERGTPDYSRSKAVLVGTSTYTYLPQVPPAANSLVRMQGLLVGNQCGWQNDRVSIFANERKPGDLPDQLVELYAGATDVALFYYVGHGQINLRDELCLALTDSRTQTERIATTSLPFDAVRNALNVSDARVKIVILDCCFAGLAVGRDDRLSSSPDVIEMTAGTGAYIMAASGAYNTAWFEQDDQATPLTYFTKHFAKIIDDGIPGEPAGLNLSAIYRSLEQDLARAGKPLPKRRVVGSADDFIFALNRAYTAAGSVEEIRMRQGSLRGLFMDDIYADPRVREEEARTPTARLSTPSLAEAVRIFQAGGGRVVDSSAPSEPVQEAAPSPERPIMEKLRQGPPESAEWPGAYGSPEGILAAARWNKLSELIAEVAGLRRAGKDYPANEVLLEVGTNRAPVVIVAAVRALHAMGHDEDANTVLAGAGERTAAVILDIVDGLRSVALDDDADRVLAIAGFRQSAGGVVAVAEALRAMHQIQDAKVVLTAVRWNRQDVISAVSATMGSFMP
jgi:hypothetical protein